MQLGGEKSMERIHIYTVVNFQIPKDLYDFPLREETELKQNQCKLSMGLSSVLYSLQLSSHLDSEV